MAMTHDEMIAVIQAHKEGKPIQVSSRNINGWSETKNPVWNFRAYDYRVAPTPTWRPFTMEEYEKHFSKSISRTNVFGQIVAGAWRPVAYDETGVFDGTDWTTYRELLEKGHRFIDTGERCGVLESQ